MTHKYAWTIHPYQPPELRDYRRTSPESSGPVTPRVTTQSGYEKVFAKRLVRAALARVTSRDPVLYLDDVLFDALEVLTDDTD